MICFLVNCIMNMNNVWFQLFITVFLITESRSLFAQRDSTATFTLTTNVDVMSRYIWRGQEYGEAPSIQPGLSATWNDFTIGAWGAYKLTGAGNQETDLYLSKTFGPITLAVWDYWSFCDTTFSNFMDYKRETTSHLLELQMLLSGGEKMPFNLLGSYFFYGADVSKSIYLELQYLHTIEPTDIVLFTGFQAKGEFYASKANFVNLGCTVTRNIKVTEHWSLPLNLSLVFNPNQKKAYVVAGITL